MNVNIKNKFLIENREFTGEEFKRLFPDIEFVKLTNGKENHNDYQYHDGLNIDIHEFNHDEKCSKGGFYFTTNSYAHKWISYRDSVGIMFYLRKVMIPDDAKVYIEDNNVFKTNKFIMGPKEPIDINMYIKYITDTDIYTHTPVHNDILKEAYKCETKQILDIVDNLYSDITKSLFETIRIKEFYLAIIDWNPMYLIYVPYELRDEELCTKGLNRGCDTHCIPNDILKKIRSNNESTHSLIHSVSYPLADAFGLSNDSFYGDSYDTYNKYNKNKENLQYVGFICNGIIRTEYVYFFKCDDEVDIMSYVKDTLTSYFGNDIKCCYVKCRDAFRIMNEISKIAKECKINIDIDINPILKHDTDYNFILKCDGIEIFETLKSLATDNKEFIPTYKFQVC